MQGMVQLPWLCRVAGLLYDAAGAGKIESALTALPVSAVMGRDSAGREAPFRQPSVPIAQTLRAVELQYLGRLAPA